MGTVLSHGLNGLPSFLMRSLSFTMTSKPLFTYVLICWRKDLKIIQLKFKAR